MGRKSAKIAAKKGATDKAKAQVYGRALKDVYRAAKSGGVDPTTNFLLKVALDRCKKFNVPKDNIDRALKKAEGPDSVGYDDVNYEGYALNGVAIFVETSTDNTTRTVANVRSYFKKCGGSLGVDGSLKFIFDRKAYFTLAMEGNDEDELTLEMIDAGAEDFDNDGEFFEITGPVEAFGDIQAKFQELGLTPEEATLERFPTTFKSVDEETLVQVERLIGMLEEDDDVVSVYHNLEEDK